MGESNDSISLETNLFEIINMHELCELPVIGFRLSARVNRRDLHRYARRLAERVLSELKVFAFPYVTDDADYIYVLGSQVSEADIKEIAKRNSISLIREFEGHAKDLRPRVMLSLLREVYDHVLTRRYGYYGVRPGTYLGVEHKIVQGNITRYRLYEGFILKVLALGEPPRYYIAIDPFKTLTYDTPLIEMLKLGNEDRWINRGMLAVYTKSCGIKVLRYGVLERIDYRYTVSQYKIPVPPYARDVCGDEVTLKKYYVCVLDAIESAHISDDEPIAFLSSYAYPPRVLYPVVRTEDLRNERTEVKKVYFLTPRERYAYTTKYRDLLVSTRIYDLPSIKLSSNPTSSTLSSFTIPKIVVGNGTEFKPDTSSATNYKKSIINELKVYGPYRRSLRPGNVVILFKKRLGISEKMILNFYSNLVNIALKDFNIRMPSNPIIRSFEFIDDVENMLSNFKDNISISFVIIAREDDEDYYSLKRTFNKFDVPSQMLTSDLIDYFYQAQADKKKRGRFRDIVRNLLIGALGKAGVIPWVLKDSLYADMYVGFDIGHRPTRESTHVATFVFLDKEGIYISSGYIMMGPQRRLKLHANAYVNLKHQFREAMKKIHKITGRDVKSVVIHKDGDVYEDDIDTFKHLAEELGFNIAIVSVKKSRGLRLYRCMSSNNTIEAPCTGDYIVLDSKRALVVNTGCEFIKQGMPRPLMIELYYTDPQLSSYTIDKAAAEVYKLSFIHWQTITSKTKLPATIAYADEWAYLLTEDVELIDAPPL